jgi:hypothetical protein
VTRTELLQHRINRESRKGLIEDRLALIEARRFTGEGPTDFGPLRPEDNLVERICAIWNLDYTPEELAIEAEERAPAEAEERAEREAERPYDRTFGEWGGRP